MPPDYPPPQPQQPQPPVQQPAPQPGAGPDGTHPAYDFIMNPAKPPKPSRLHLPGSGPTGLLARVALIGGGLVVLIILFSIIKSLVFKGPDLTGFVTVAQQQQELIHLANNASNNNQQPLSTSNQNLAATVNLALSSNQAQVVKYLANNHQKVKAKTLNLKVNTALDTQLTNAQAAGTYDQTFQSILQSQLTTYINSLKQTYQASGGKIGRALLSNQYNQAVLLLNQAAAPATSS